MKFQEIDFDLNFGKVPFEIGVIFKYSFWEGKLYNRYQKIKGENFSSFVPYGDYWAFIEKREKGLIYGENGESLEDISPYYEAYSKGFLDGYFEFENEIKESSHIFYQNSFAIENIFDEIKIEVLPFASRGYFYKNDDSKEKPISIIKKDLLYSGGLKIGRNYKAWFYIIKNPKPFIQLFREFYSSTFELYENEFREWNSHHEGYISPLQIVIDEIQGKATGEKNTIENKFNQMPMDEVREHFKQLIEKKNPNKDVWMTKQNFDVFLKRSFGGQTNLPKPNINIGNRGKFAIVKLFHNFYEKTLDHPYNGPREKDKVFNLLKDAFNTSIFEKERKDNFKSDKSKYPWD